MPDAVRSIDLRDVPPAEADLGEFVEHLRTGGALIYPTETVYGIGARCSPEGVDRVARLKRREPDKPLIVLIGRREQADDLEWSDQARELATIFWPGAVTLVLPDPRHRFPEGIRSRDGAVAVRMSPHPLVARLLDQLDEPLTSTSANAPGEEPARSGREAAEVARRLGGGADVLVMDGGTLPASGPSTVVDCTSPEPVVIRQGTVPVGRLRCVLPGIHGR